MKQTKMTLQLADKIIKSPFGIDEDVLVQVDKFLLIFDFVVMDIKDDDKIPLILRWSFIKTTRMLIVIDDGEMKIRDQDEEVYFNLFKTTWRCQTNDVKQTFIGRQTNFF